MPDTVCSIEEVQALLRPLVGLPVSLPWKGYGSTIFLELGELTPVASKRERHGEGEACIWVDWDWRIEDGTKILFGSSNSGPGIETGLKLLRDTSIQALDIVGQVPELVVQFFNGCCLRSMAMLAGNPEWSIRLQDGTYIYPRQGRFFRGEGDGDSITDEESATMDLAERTAERWGIPTSAPKAGACADCQWFVRLDGHYELLDYGVCAAAEGPLDGQVVRVDSGCPLFASKQGDFAGGTTDRRDGNGSPADEETA